MKGLASSHFGASLRSAFVAGALVVAFGFGWLPAGAQQQEDPADQPAAVMDQPGDAVGQPAASGKQPEATIRQPADTPAQPVAANETPAPQLREVPRSLTLKRGTIITARTSQFLSSERNKPGDSFSAELEQPIVVDGWVVARRGQTVMGRVAMAQKAGRIKGTSRLAVEINKLILVDGQQVAIHTQLLQASGDTSKGRDAQAVGTTTGMGAAIGGVANGGEGAGIGAGIGAAAGLAGVLLTRGHPTVIPPETTLTFELSTPIAISTSNSGPAFRPVVPQDYGPADRDRLQRRPGRYAQRPYGPSPYYYSWFGPWGYPGPFFVGFTYFGGHGRHRGLGR
jgi:hypothetical protein